MASTNANSLAWATVFDKFQMLDSIKARGYVDVSAQQLKTVREPRHMGKIDHEENLPDVFKEHGLAILTTSNSSYRVGRFNIFQKLPKWEPPSSEVKTISFPIELETLDIKNLTSEPAVLNAAFSSGMLADFCEENLVLTVSGRMRTGEFDFFVDQTDGTPHQIQVRNAQMEIDAGFEGKSSLHIFEAKNHSASNFNLRQIYYPTASWTRRIRKPVNPIFLTFSNDVFDLFQFEFTDGQNFSSAKLSKHSRYMLAHETPAEIDLLEFASDSKKRASRNIEKAPFPQADSFAKVIDLLAILMEEPRSLDDLTTHFEFDQRQSDYYSSALRYLGLAFKKQDDAGNTLFYLTEDAEQILKLPYREKYTKLAERILEIEPAAEAFIFWHKTGTKASKGQIAEWMKRFKDTANLSDSTITRRAQTLSAWVDWVGTIVGAPGEFSR